MASEIFDLCKNPIVKITDKHIYIERVAIDFFENVKEIILITNTLYVVLYKDYEYKDQDVIFSLFKDLPYMRINDSDVKLQIHLNNKNIDTKLYIFSSNKKCVMQSVPSAFFLLCEPYNEKINDYVELLSKEKLLLAYTGETYPIEIYRENWYHYPINNKVFIYGKKPSYMIRRFYFTFIDGTIQICF